eukprot:2123571-Pleurochrysis_carterae.AAC.1
MPRSAHSKLTDIADSRVGGPEAETPRPPRKAYKPSRAPRSVRSSVLPLSPSRDCYYRGWWVGGTSRPPPRSVALIRRNYTPRSIHPLGLYEETY